MQAVPNVIRVPRTAVTSDIISAYVTLERMNFLHIVKLDRQ